ncbi:MAG TPA: amidophosphoribosyltransferase [Candidatus Bathyarchaeia archaeon]|nr:amidophosphoribosyltransferase [Candidatus Bathyarchaeia archaeon]
MMSLVMREVEAMEDAIKEECGVFAAKDFKGDSVFQYVYWGLRGQNHRGHQSHGILTYDGSFHAYKGLDLVPKLKKSELQSLLDNLPGHVGIGNVRYTTSGGTDEQSLVKGTQPFFLKTNHIGMAIAFNGNIVNTVQLRWEIRNKVLDFSYDCDVELLGNKLLMSLLENKDLSTAVRDCMTDVEGAFSVVGVTQEGELFGFKDPYGIKPLCCGRHPTKSVWALSSETVGLDINGFQFDFEVNPGELVVATKDGFTRTQIMPRRRKALCAFEFAYFARPDSRLGNRYVYEVREEFGRNLTREYPEVTKDADLIVSMPETGDDVAYGMHETTGLRWERSIRRHRYVTERAFILLADERHATIDRKINVLPQKIDGKKVLVTEDSIVRGDTTKVVVEKLRRLGAKKIHLFITYPRIIGPCFYGIDMATYSELIGFRHAPDEIATIIGADSVNYQSVEGFVKSIGMSEEELCMACVTGKYPTPLAQKMADEMKANVEKGHEETGRVYEVASVI